MSFTKNNFFRFFFFATLLSLILIEVGFSQTNNEANSEEFKDKYYDEPVELRKLNEQKWEELTKDLNYKTKKEKPEKPVRENRDRQSSNSPSPSIGIPDAVFYIFFIAILIFIIAKILGINLVINKSIPGEKNISIDSLEEEIHESDLEKYLREALSKQNYKLAIRIYYLIILKELSLNNNIQWKKDKTNREYLYEMSQKENYGTFYEITRTFEKIWYGDLEIKETDYAVVSPAFKNFVESIKQQNK